MTIEAKLESLERSIYILNDTIKELIDLYLDTQTNPVLGDLPKTLGFEPKVIKQRRAIAKKKKNNKNVTMLELRDLTNQLVDRRGIEFTTRILGRYNISSLAELTIENYESYYNAILEVLNHEE